MGRSILAVVAGYVAMFVGVAVGLTLLLLAFSDAFPSEPGPYDGPAFVLVLELLMSWAAAVGGGYVCGWVAGGRETKHALALGAVMLVLGVISAVVEAGLKPMWSSVALGTLSPVFVVVGAGIRRRHRERRALAER